MAALTFRPGTPEAVRHIAVHLRQADRDELAITSPGRTAEQILDDALSDSRWCTVAYVDGEPAIAYGVAPTHKLGVGAPWMLATDRLADIERDFVRGCRGEVDLMLRSFSMLTNAVHCDNKLVLRWLRWLGFTVMDRHPFGPGDQLLPFFKRSPGHV